VVRGPDAHELRDLTVDVSLEGDFDAAYRDGDNTDLIATDTMRNTVYALAYDDPLSSLESFARRLVEHFVETGPTVRHARVRIAEQMWARLGDHPHAFQRGAGGTRVAWVSDTSYEAGIEDLLVLKTTESGWAGFHRDRFTTLPETDDRILATVVSARWEYSDAGDFTEWWEAAREALLAAFGDHYSPSVQFTLQRMGEAVLAAVPEIARVHLSLPNKHHLLFDLERFGIANENVVFQATDEPYGLIEGTIERG
jgi:urate oxidase